MRIRRAAGIAGVVVAAVVVAGGALVGASVVLRAPAVDASAGKPYPILGPITPAGHPYDELAILRRQRMSDDVLPAAAIKTFDNGGQGPTIVPASARLIASAKTEKYWVAVDSKGESCLLTTADGAYGSGCASVSGAKPGELLQQMSTSKHDGFELVTDGVPAPGVVSKGYRQVAPNVWMDSRSTATPAPTVVFAHDPLAFPSQSPYAHFAILRRAATTADTVPAKWSSDDDAAPAGSAVLTTLRFAGTYRGTSAWVTTSTGGGVCLILEAKADAGPETACADSGDEGVSVAAGDNGDGGEFDLVRDGQHGYESGSTRLAPNVWVAPPQK